MIKKITSVIFLIISFFLCVNFMQATKQNSLEYRSEATLGFSSKLFESANERVTIQSENKEPDIILFAKIFKAGMGRDASKQTENLKNFFNLKEIAVRKESEEVEITWESWKKKRKDLPKISQTFRLEGEEYSIFLIPDEIDSRKRIFRFMIEIHKTQKTEESQSLKYTELLLKKNILWNFHGPLVLGFFSENKIYFLSWTIRAKISTYGPRISGGISWIL